MNARSMAGLALTLGVVMALGCRDSTGPDAFVGTYQLERYEGLPLPAVLQQTSTSSVSILNEVLRIGDGGTALQTSTVRQVTAETPQGKNVSYTATYAYVVRGSTIELRFVCPPDADCIIAAPVVAELTSSGLAISRPASSKPASLYRRVRSTLF